MNEQTTHSQWGRQGDRRVLLGGLVMLEVRHTLDLTAMQLTACQSRGRGTAAWQLPSWVGAYLPRNTTVLKNIQTLSLTKGKGVFQIFCCLFCREIKIQAIKIKACIGFCKHRCEQSLNDQNYLPIFHIFKSKLSALLEPVDSVWGSSIR